MKTLTAAAFVLAALTTAHAAEPIATPFKFVDPAIGGLATLQTYHATCGQTVPPPILNMMAIVTRTMPAAEKTTYAEAVAEVWKQKQRLGTDGFCAALRPVLEPRIPALLAGAIETGIGF